MKEAINSAVILAVKLRKLHFVKFAVEKGADVNTKNKVINIFVVFCFILCTFHE